LYNYYISFAFASVTFDAPLISASIPLSCSDMTALDHFYVKCRYYRATAVPLERHFTYRHIPPSTLETPLLNFTFLGQYVIKGLSLFILLQEKLSASKWHRADTVFHAYK
jgi:hypothetical protein